LLRAVVVFVLVVADWVGFRWRRHRLSGSHARHEPIEVRTRADHDIIIPQNLAVIALACMLIAASSHPHFLAGISEPLNDALTGPVAA